MKRYCAKPLGVADLIRLMSKHAHTHTYTSWCCPLKFSDSGVLITDQWQPAFLTKMTMTMTVFVVFNNWRPQKQLKVISCWWTLAAQMFGCLECTCATSQTSKLYSLVHCNLSWQREYRLPSMLMALRSDNTPSRQCFLVPWKGRVFCNSPNRSCLGSLSSLIWPRWPSQWRRHTHKHTRTHARTHTHTLARMITERWWAGHRY